MTDEQRMERAERIRRMRQGLREDDSDETESESEDSETSSTDDARAGEDTAGDARAGEDTAGVETEQASPEPASSPTTETEPAPSETTMQVQDDSPEAETEASEDTTPEQEPENGSEALEAASSARAELPDAEKMEAALEDAGEVSEEGETEEPAGGPAAGIAGDAVESTTEAETRVLEFTLAGEEYGLDIEYIEEIVKQETITRVPNTPDFVEGVVDLRGQITTILNPKVTIGKDDTSRGDLIVVFDSGAFDDQNIGWVVDDVQQVAPVHDENVNDPPMEEGYINGVIDRGEDEKFVIWTTPDLALEETA